MSDRLVAALYTLGIAAVGQLGLGLFINSFDVLAAPWWAQVVLLAVSLAAGAAIWLTGFGLSPEEKFSRELRELRKVAGRPAISDLAADLRTRLSAPPAHLDDAIESTLAGDTRPSWPFAEALIEACLSHADTAHIGMRQDQRDLVRWNGRYDQLFGRQNTRQRLALIGISVVAILGFSIIVAVGASRQKDAPPAASSTSSTRGESASPAPTSSAATPSSHSSMSSPLLTAQQQCERLTRQTDHPVRRSCAKYENGGAGSADVDLANWWGTNPLFPEGGDFAVNSGGLSASNVDGQQRAYVSVITGTPSFEACRDNHRRPNIGPWEIKPETPICIRSDQRHMALLFVEKYERDSFVGYILVWGTLVD